MKSVFSYVILHIAIAALFVSCTKEQNDHVDSLQVQFNIALQPQTRAAEQFNPNTHTAKAYLFKESTPESGQYTYVSESAITGNNLTLQGLQSSVSYRIVFLAIPRWQQPSLPNLTISRPNYTDAMASFISSNTATSNEIFRNILSFTASTSISTQQHTVVLTRQNGAIQIRVNNIEGKIRTVKLDVQCRPQIYFNDNASGMVLTTGGVITLSKSERPSKIKDSRITINILPAEDITGKGRLTVTHTNGWQRVYDLVSTSGSIPIYPNQITWLTFNEDDDDGCDGSHDEESSSDDQPSTSESYSYATLPVSVSFEPYLPM